MLTELRTRAVICSDLLGRLGRLAGCGGGMLRAGCGLGQVAFGSGCVEDESSGLGVFLLAGFYT
jgi:hypothetical protein